METQGGSLNRCRWMRAMRESERAGRSEEGERRAKRPTRQALWDHERVSRESESSPVNPELRTRVEEDRPSHPRSVMSSETTEAAAVCSDLTVVPPARAAFSRAA